VNRYIKSRKITVYRGDCREILPTLPENSIDSIVTDPPYGLEFMGKDWDNGVPGAEFWKAIFRVAKPGAHLLAFGGTRTFHRLACAIEDAGWEIRDCLMWVYGSGFPKSLDVSKSIDKAAGIEREVIGDKLDRPGYHLHGHKGGEAFGHGISSSTPETRLKSAQITAPSTPATKQWSGWGTALKPAWEPIIMARKPLDGTVAGNVQKWGVGGINIDGCRVEKQEGDESGWSKSGSKSSENRSMSGKKYARAPKPDSPGRFPANVIHDGSEEVVGRFPSPHGAGYATDTTLGTNPDNWDGKVFKHGGHGMRHGDSGSASRFFYCTKASRSERGKDNVHPTVKPLELMKYLIKLVTPRAGRILDPFLGSGSTALAAIDLGFRCIGIEIKKKYCKIVVRRLSKKLLIGKTMPGKIKLSEYRNNIIVGKKYIDRYDYDIVRVTGWSKSQPCLVRVKIIRGPLSYIKHKTSWNPQRLIRYKIWLRRSRLAKDRKRK